MIRFLNSMSTYKKVTSINDALGGILTVGGTVDLGTSAQTALDDIVTNTAASATLSDALAVEQRRDATYGHTPIRLHGATETLAVTFEGIGDAYTKVATVGLSDEQIQVVSTSTNDTAGGEPGTGVRQVRVVYVNLAGTQFSELVSMNGTTVVPLANNGVGVNSLAVTQVGSGMTNAGDIRVQNDPNTIEYVTMPAGKATTDQMTYVCPANRQMFMTSINGRTASNINILLELVDYNITPNVLIRTLFEAPVNGVFSFNTTGVPPITAGQALQLNGRAPSGSNKFITIELYGMETDA